MTMRSRKKPLEPVVSSTLKWPSGRTRSEGCGATFEMLRARIAESVSVVDLTSPALTKRNHHSWAWDASAMPAGGHYFPVFVELIEKLERDEGIHPDTHILCETTTGTAGIALGFIAKQLGYRVVIFMPEDMPERRIKAVRDNLPNGSELFLTPAGQYVRGVVRAFRTFVAKHRNSYEGMQLCLLDHSRRPEAVSAISSVIRSALTRLPQSFRIDYAVAALGNGTSSSALFEAVRETYPKASRVGVEPLEAPTAFVRKYGEDALFLKFHVRGPWKSHALVGTGGWGVTFPHLDVSAIDAIRPLAFDEWLREQEALAQRNIDVGNSSAACQAVVETLSRKSRKAPAGFFSIVYDRSSVY